MPRRSRRNRNPGIRATSLIVLLLVLIAGAWFWQRSSGDSGGAPDAIEEIGTRQGDRNVAALPLPPADSTRVQQARSASPGATEPDSAALPAFLPPEARHTLDLIARGGPFPHRQDGSVFGNREGRLPAKPRGYYHEYTVDTPGLDHRGARRIVTGGQPPSEYYYSDDHYGSFRRFDVSAQVRR